MARSILALGPIPTSSPPPPPHFNKHPAAASFPSRSSSSNTPALALAGSPRSGSKRRERELVVRAGPPSTNSLILAFVLPFSLIAGTIFTSIRIADRLDEKYLEELAINQAIMEENEAASGEEEEDDDDDEREPEVAERVVTAAAAGVDGDGKILLQKDEEVAAVPRARNRPRRRGV